MAVRTRRDRTGNVTSKSLKVLRTKIDTSRVARLRLRHEVTTIVAGGGVRNKHRATMLPSYWKIDLQDRLQEVACITESQSSSGHLDSQPHRSTVWLCSVTSQGLERHPLDRWPWICLQRITLRASQESGVAICGNTTQRSTSNLARSLI